jgi:DNA-binding MarR family transcriptional regulator
MQRQESIGALIGFAHRRIRQMVAGRVSDLQLSPQQFWILVRIREHEGSSLGELAQETRVDEPTASRAVFTLAGRGFVRSEQDPQDRRRSRLLLTPEGRRLSERLRPLSDEIRGVVEGALTPGERAVVQSALQKVIGRLDRLEEQAVEGRVAP